MTGLVPLKRVAAINAGQSPPSEHVSDVGNGLPFLQGNAEFGAMHPAARYACDAAPKRCLAGDVLLSVRAPVGALNVADQPYGIGRGLCSITPLKLVPRYLWWAMNASVTHLQSLATGSTYGAVAADDVGGLVVRVPSWPEQQAVADYLDAETARIDDMVSARTQQLALIDERLEVEAATLLNATQAPLVALRRVVDLLPGFSYRSEDFLTDPGHARLLRGINVDVGALRWDDTVWVNESVATTTSRFALAAGDIVMGMDRPVISAGVRVARVTEADLPACLVQRVARLRARPGLSQEYLHAALRGPTLADHFAPVFTGVSVPHVSPSQILSYEIPLPPVARQGEIVRELVTMEGRVRGYQAAARRQIELLQERRQALITAAVTGQLEIPGVAA